VLKVPVAGETEFAPLERGLEGRAAVAPGTEIIGEPVTGGAFLFGDRLVDSARSEKRSVASGVRTSSRGGRRGRASGSGPGEDECGGGKDEGGQKK